MYAYLVGQMTVMGYDILGESQLAGSPPIPLWDIPDAQFPEVTMVWVPCSTHTPDKLLCVGLQAMEPLTAPPQSIKTHNLAHTSRR